MIFISFLYLAGLEFIFATHNKFFMFSEKLNHSCGKCPAAWKNFGNLTADEIKLVDQNRYEATFKNGEIIIKQGAPSASAVFLASGIAKTYIEGLDGRNFILGIALPGTILPGPGVYLSGRYSYSVAALSVVHACFISFDIINKLVRQNPSFAMGMLEDISSKSIFTQNRLVSLAQKKMQGRIAEALLFFADNVFKSDQFDMLLSRQELGEMTNMAKESVVRILKELESGGVIKTACSNITITDRKKLTLISERGDDE
jgi:CRP/FNR family transcriptional regulator